MIEDDDADHEEAQRKVYSAAFRVVGLVIYLLVLCVFGSIAFLAFLFRHN